MKTVRARKTSPLGRKSGEDTRARLIAAAEQLFAERGVDGVSLSEVVSFAEQGNASAINYHFGNREGLLSAVLQKHQPGIEKRRNELLEAIEARQKANLRPLVEALVQPLSEKLDDPDGGRAYLQLMDQLLRSHYSMLVSTPDDARERLMRLIRGCLPEMTDQLANLRGILAATQLFSALAFVARQEEDGLLDEGERRVFVGNLIDCITGSLRAPVSAAVQSASNEAHSTTGSP